MWNLFGFDKTMAQTQGNEKKKQQQSEEDERDGKLFFPKKPKKMARTDYVSKMPSLQPILSFSMVDGDSGKQVNGFSSDIDVSEVIKFKMTSSEKHQVSSSTSSLNQEKSVTECKMLQAKSKVHSVVAKLVKNQAPTLLMVESLIWTICCIYENEYQSRQDMFLTLCRSLEHLKVIGASYMEESLQPIRDKISVMFHQKIIQYRDPNGVAATGSPTLDIDYLKSRPAEILKKALHWNRYTTEFEEICIIAKGGFGTVKKARHRFDNTQYAIKQINFFYKTYKCFEQIIREVQLLAKLEYHPNVVNYKTAWIQNWTCGVLARRRSRTMSTTDAKIVEIESESIIESVETSDDSSDENLLRGKFYNKDSSSSSDVNFEVNESTMNGDIENMDFQEDEEEEVEDEEEEEEFEESGFGIMPSFSCDKSPKECTELALKRVDFELPESPATLRATLFIQMELCGRDLHAYLEERNLDIVRRVQLDPSLDPLELVSLSTELSTFRQILNGVKHIHTKGLIHRDLKPRNIMFSLDGCRVKIGDFGLATLHHKVGSEGDSFPLLPVEHTTNLGTTIYAAPEQKTVSDTALPYDHRVDIYSLGIIFFELLYPMSTMMEKGHCIQDLKNGKMPESLAKRWPHLVQLILFMVSYMPEHRPKTIDEVFLLINPNQTLRSSAAAATSKRSNRALIQENYELRQKLLEKDRLIEQLQEQIRNLTLTNKNH